MLDVLSRELITLFRQFGGLQATCCQRARNHYLIAGRGLSAPRMMGLVPGRADRQMLNRLEAWHAAPLDLGLVHQLESRPTPEQGLEPLAPSMRAS